MFILGLQPDKDSRVDSEMKCWRSGSKQLYKDESSNHAVNVSCSSSPPTAMKHDSTFPCPSQTVGSA